MCDNTDPFTGSARLCHDGITAGGWSCTGHAHVAGEHLRCTDDAHKPAPYMLANVSTPGILIPTGPPVSLDDLVRRSLQAETLNGRTRHATP